MERTEHKNKAKNSNDSQLSGRIRVMLHFSGLRWQTMVANGMWHDEFVSDVTWMWEKDNLHFDSLFVRARPMIRGKP